MVNPLQNEIAHIRYVRKKLTYFFNKMVEVYGGDEVIDELMLARQYWLPEIKDYLKRIGVYKAGNYSDLRFIDDSFTDELLTDFGLLVNGEYYMTGRYVLPIRDIRGDVIALVGWDKRGGIKKYLTTATVGFNRDTSFFNFDLAFRDAWAYRDGKVFLVEGIFDSILPSAFGFPAIATMGLGLSVFKEIMLSRFSQVIVVTDSDRGGRSVVPFLYTAEKGIHPKALQDKEKTVWRPRTKSTYTRLPVEVKDMSDYVNFYEVSEELENLYKTDVYTKLR